MNTHLRVLSESYPMNTNMRRFRLVSLRSCALDESSLSIGSVKANEFDHQKEPPIVHSLINKSRLKEF